MAKWPGSHEMYLDAVLYLCRYLDELRAFVEPDVWDSCLEVIRERDPSTDDWHEAVYRLQRAVDHGGVPGGLGLTFPMGDGGQQRAVPASGQSSWMCPVRRCSRSEPDEKPEAQAPYCSVGGKPMSRLLTAVEIGEQPDGECRPAV